MLASLALVLLAQSASPPQQASDTMPARPRRGDPAPLPAYLRQRVAPVAATTPPSRDTANYWQQRMRYTIVAALEEKPGVVHARGTMVYVNNSPDTLREMYVHQHLNAFRPGSKWSATDEREGRVRFQRLAEPNFAYERFTSAPTVDGTPVDVDYPGAPDSTVAHFALPRALAPNESVTVAFRWDARPSTVPRRQARRGRSFDLAQWFPKPAVYDRGGWEAHAFVPAGELYGEFGDYDVTLVLPKDQVIGATGVPVSGDPGWGDAARAARDAYPDVPPAADVPVPDGYKAVRFYARNVHHFAWSASPDYRYEGGVYVRRPDVASGRVRAWDTVSVHVLYRPNDVREWGGGQAVENTRRALAWLESRYGAYAYPQMTVLHRIEGGGTEFPMMQMNGSASQGLILHEGGHVWSYGILANNEWRSGWMDEGLTEYQTEWAQGLTRPERVAHAEPLAAVIDVAPTLPTPDARPTGYARLAVRPRGASETPLFLYALDLQGRDQPIGLQSERFRDFGTYNTMIYSRAAMMYGALRDVLGDSAFTAFLHTYYARWALRHVDEAAMRSSAEAAYGRDLGWFFDQWVHRTGLIDYRVAKTKIERTTGGYVTLVTVKRVGSYRHPMPVGVRTKGGWTVVRADALPDEQVVGVATTDAPLEVALDPSHVTEDWYRPNDSRSVRWWRTAERATARNVIDWPFLDQASEDRVLAEYRPQLWSSAPNGAVIGLRVRTNYQGLVDQGEVGVVFGTRRAREAGGGSTLAPRDGTTQWWVSGANPRLLGRQLMGTSYGLWNLDGVSKVRLAKAWDTSPFTFSAGVHETSSVAFTGAYMYSRALTDPARWSGVDVSEGSYRYARHTPGPVNVGLTADASLGMKTGRPLRGASLADRLYGRLELAATRTERVRDGRFVTFARAYAGYAERAPLERQIYASVSDPTTTFGDDLWRPLGGALAPSTTYGGDGYRTLADGHYRPLGGAALRAYDPLLPLGSVVAGNVEGAVRVVTLPHALGGLALYASAFADAGLPLVSRTAYGQKPLGDVGPGVSLRGTLFDRPVRVRVDAPYLVRFAPFGAHQHADLSHPTLTFSFDDLW